MSAASTTSIRPPNYCDDQSEGIFGHALPLLPRESFFVSTKSAESDGTELRARLERSLERLGLDHIDFFHIWCLMSLDDWEKRRQGGALDAALRAQEEGLVRHVVCSSHMDGPALAQVLDSGHFAGVTLGYNAINFPYREAAVRNAGARRVGVVAMNPLSGGLIPQNAERFGFLKQPGESSVVPGALRFVISDPHVTVALVGFSNTAQVDEAVAAASTVSSDAAALQAELRQHIEAEFDGVCTGCQYCLPCPVGIPIPKLMDVYNAMLLAGGDPAQALDRYKWHWSLREDLARRCEACGDCEARCTQHLNIIERLAALPPPAVD